MKRLVLVALLVLPGCAFSGALYFPGQRPPVVEIKQASPPPPLPPVKEICRARPDGVRCWPADEPEPPVPSPTPSPSGEPR